ncbi:hypothetical protein [Phocaeicola oris]|uniref:hypothetical protein n=1 Tax=Phocaeicola oris TaxID=2896850 RepID=UPI00234F92B4|nr:hypothetical protein [Phocaeicola oris]MCE2615755.1 hypothetical protein [Phocaeicola oris]
MKKSKFIKLVGCIVIMLLVALAKKGHIHLPGHGNWENKNFEEAVVNYVSSLLINGEKVEFGNKFLCEDYKENDEVRFSANVIYYVVSRDGTKEKHIAHVVCNEDKDRIIEWKDITNN